MNINNEEKLFVTNSVTEKNWKSHMVKFKISVIMWGSISIETTRCKVSAADTE